MIDFRYHIVSLIAVFLALGVGILVGTTVLDAATVSVLRRQVQTLGNNLDSTRREISELRAESDRGRAVIEAATPWTTEGRLAGRRVVLVYDGQAGGWRDVVRDGLVEAGAQPVGSMTLTDRWKLDEAGSVDELGTIAAETVGAIGSTPANPAEYILPVLGRRIFQPDGQMMIRRLADARFLTLDGADPKDAWPPSGALVVAFGSPAQKASAAPHWLAALTRGAAEGTGTLVAAASAEDWSAVSLLRTADGLPPGLATFDAGSADYAKVGAVLALDAAARSHGAHFGLERGRKLVPERR